MTAVLITTAIFVLVLLAAVVLAWHGLRRPSVGGEAVYLMPEAVEFVAERLSEEARGRLTKEDVRRILEWGVRYHQVVAPREEGRRPVVGSGDAMDYILERGAASGAAYDPFDVAEVIAAETEYLVEIGAVGGPVEDGAP